MTKRSGFAGWLDRRGGFRQGEPVEDAVDEYASEIAAMPSPAAIVDAAERTP